METPAKPPFQFGVRHLLAATTLVAVVAGVGALLGTGAALIAVAAVTAIANASGALQRWQGPARAARWTWAGWLLLLVALATPSVRGCGSESIPGWRAAWVPAAVQADSLWKVGSPGEAGRQAVEHPVRFAAVQLFLTAINVGNLLLAVSPLALLLWRNNRGGGLNGLIVVAAACACSLGWKDSTGLLIGYYLWCASLLLVMCAVRSRWSWVVGAAITATAGAWALQAPS